MTFEYSLTDNPRTHSAILYLSSQRDDSWLLGLPDAVDIRRSYGGAEHTDPRLLSAVDDNLGIPVCGTDAENTLRSSRMVRKATLTEVVGQKLIPFEDGWGSRTGRTAVVTNEYENRFIAPQEERHLQLRGLEAFR